MRSKSALISSIAVLCSIGVAVYCILRSQSTVDHELHAHESGRISWRGRLVAVSPNGIKAVVHVPSTNRIVIHDISTGRKKDIGHSSSQYVGSATIDDNGRCVVVREKSNSLCVWHDNGEGLLRHGLNGTVDSVLAMSEDCSKLAMLCDNEIMLYGVNEGEILWSEPLVFFGTGWPQAIILEDSIWVMDGYKGVVQLDVFTGQVVGRFPSSQGIAFDIRENALAIVERSRQLTVWDVATQSVTRRLWLSDAGGDRILSAAVKIQDSSTIAVVMQPERERPSQIHTYVEVFDSEMDISHLWWVESQDNLRFNHVVNAHFLFDTRSIMVFFVFSSMLEREEVTVIWRLEKVNRP